MESSSASSGSSKRAKAPINNTAQVASCLVDGCDSDLSQCRDYHRRHKVCELHSKAPMVTIGGWKQRFCQQCSRFHSLVEFDEGKRSCRKRLDGHNRRRRKLQSEVASSNSGMFLSNQQGSTMLSFGSPQVLPSAVRSLPWAGIAKAENDFAPYGTHTSFNYINTPENIPQSFARSYEERDQFQNMLVMDPTPPEVSAHSLLLNPNPVSGNSGSSEKTLYDGLNQGVDFDSALSLLSSHPAETREIGSSDMVQPNPDPQDHSLNCVFGYPKEWKIS